MDGRPVDAVREWLITKLIEQPGKKIVCPACDRVCSVYKRSLNADQARALVHFYREHGTDWGEFQDVRRAHTGLDGREEGKAAYWGLIEFKRVGTFDKKKRRPGKITYMKITDKGEMWLNSDIKIPRWALIYYGKVLEFRGEDVSLEEILAKKDYELEDLLS